MSIYSTLVAVWVFVDIFLVTTYRGTELRFNKTWKLIKYIIWAYLLYLAGAR